jgi:hypothetical protein
VILCQYEWVLHRLISDEASGLDFLNEHLSQPEKNKEMMKKDKNYHEEMVFCYQNCSDLL